MKFYSTLLLSALLAFSTPAEAAITLVTSGQAQSSAGGATTTGFLNTAGGTLAVACVASDHGDNLTYMMQDSLTNTWNRSGKEYVTGNNQFQLFWSLLTSTSGAHTFTYPGGFSSIFVFVFSGTATSSVTDGAATLNGNAGLTTIQPGSITASQNGDVYVVGVGGDAGSGGYTTTGFTTTLAAAQTANAYTGSCAYFVQSTAAALNPSTGTWPSTNLHAIMQAFKAPGGAPPPTNSFPFSAVTP